jgi:hypothetical protein
MTSIELDAAYRRTIYEVLLADSRLVLRIDERNPQLLALHRSRQVDDSTFLSAWNPRSVVQTADQNNDAHERLLQRLSELNLECWPGWGRDPDGIWPAEQSLLVLGLDLPGARALGAGFSQNAVVHSGADAVPRLVWVD